MPGALRRGGEAGEHLGPALVVGLGDPQPLAASEPGGARPLLERGAGGALALDDPHLPPGARRHLARDRGAAVRGRVVEH